MGAEDAGRDRTDSIATSGIDTKEEEEGYTTTLIVDKAYQLTRGPIE